MSAYALIIGLAHVSAAPVVISGPEVPYAEQRQKFKDFMALRVHEKFQRVDFVDSRRGIRKRKSLISPKDAKAREKAAAAEAKDLAKTATPPAEEIPPTPPETSPTE